MSLTSCIGHLYGTWKPGALSQLSRVGNRDKTVTARHRETPDREVGTSECCIVMMQIAVETLLRTKVQLTSNRYYMARNFNEPVNGRRQMNENVNLSCALPHHTDNWHTIIWRKVIQNVRRLQSRIAKAVKEGRWGKAKALMHLVSKSFYAKLLAVFRVTSNKGGNTPGVDNIVWKNDLDKLHAARSLKARGYTPMPLRRVYILKKSGKSDR